MSRQAYTTTIPQDVSAQKKRDISSLVYDRNKEVPKKRTKTTKEPKKCLMDSTVKIWIGATVMQRECSNESVSGGAFCTYYGPKDRRNDSKKVCVSKDQGLVDVLFKGVIYVLNKYKSNTETLTLYVGSGEFSRDMSEYQLYSEIDKLMVKRDGETFITYASRNELRREREFKDAVRLAKKAAISKKAEKLENDELSVVPFDMQKNETELTIKKSMTSKQEKIAIKEENTASEVTNLNEEALVQEAIVREVTVFKEEFAAVDEIEQQETLKSAISILDVLEKDMSMKDTPDDLSLCPGQTNVSNWSFNISFRNIVDVLKAPFVRK